MDARRRLRSVVIAVITLGSIAGGCAPRQTIVAEAPRRRDAATAPVVLTTPADVDADRNDSIEKHPVNKVALGRVVVAPSAEAAPARVIERNSRAVALLPFGVGQLQNGDTGLGVAFAVSEALAGGASIAFAAMVHYYQDLDPNQRDASGAALDLAAVNRAIETQVLANRVAFGAWAALTLGGVLQAQIAFVPERTSTSEGAPFKRQSPVIVPIVAFSQGAANFGLAGSF